MSKSTIKYHSCIDIDGEGKRDNRNLPDLQSAVLELVHLAEEQTCRLVAYSQREFEMVKQHLLHWPQLAQCFGKLYWNVKSDSQRLCSRRRLRTLDKALDSLVKAYASNSKSHQRPGAGLSRVTKRLHT